jgi:Uma2 family endonuclease
VKAVLSLSRRATYADYLAVEQMSERRHEFFDGVIVALAGGSDEHNAIAMQFGGLCVARVRGGCKSYSPDQRFWIAATTRARYSEGSIIWGRPEHPPHDAQATTNPSVIIEVLSPSSAGDDDGDKRRDFKSLASLQAYVIAAQDSRWVKVYRRTERGEWRSEPDVYRDGDGFELPSLTRPITVDEIYDGVLDGAGHSLLR